MKLNLSKILFLILTVVIYLATVFPHELVGTEINEVFKNVDRATYNKIILIILSISLLLLCGFVGRQLIRHVDRRKKGLFYLFVTLFFCFICMKYLMVINIEAIHFLQYAILSILVFHLVRRYDYTIWIILFLAFLDESYQHFFLSMNRFGFLDFNDMFLDLVGAGFGISTLYCLNKTSGPTQPIIKKGILFTYLGLALLTITLYLAGILRVYPVEGMPPADIQIMYRPIEGFWQTYRKVFQFHIMRPWEGILILLATTYFYSQLDE